MTPPEAAFLSLGSSILAGGKPGSDPMLAYLALSLLFPVASTLTSKFHCGNILYFTKGQDANPKELVRDRRTLLGARRLCGHGREVGREIR